MRHFILSRAAASGAFEANTHAAVPGKGRYPDPVLCGPTWMRSQVYSFHVLRRRSGCGKNHGPRGPSSVREHRGGLSSDNETRSCGHVFGNHPPLTPSAFPRKPLDPRHSFASLRASRTGDIRQWSARFRVLRDQAPPPPPSGRLKVYRNEFPGDSWQHNSPARPARGESVPSPTGPSRARSSRFCRWESHRQRLLTRAP